MDILLLVKITQRRWSLRILALLNQEVPARQAPLLAKLDGVGRTAFAQSLRHLIDLGLLERTPGHGHPLRPEFRLTPMGKTISPMAERIEKISLSDDARSCLRHNWSLPIVAASPQPVRFSALRTTLAPITDRALSQSLGRLHAEHLIARSVYVHTRPPKTTYQITDLAVPLYEAISETFTDLKFADGL